MLTYIFFIKQAIKIVSNVKFKNKRIIRSKNVSDFLLNLILLLAIYCIIFEGNQEK